MSRVSTLFICVLLCLQTVCCGSTRRRENIPDTVAGEATRSQTWNHAESRLVKGNDAALCQISIKSWFNLSCSQPSVRIWSSHQALMWVYTHHKLLVVRCLAQGHFDRQPTKPLTLCFLNSCLTNWAPSATEFTTQTSPVSPEGPVCTLNSFSFITRVCSLSLDLQESK